MYRSLRDERRTNFVRNCPPLQFGASPDRIGRKKHRDTDMTFSEYLECQQFTLSGRTEEEKPRFDFLLKLYQDLESLECKLRRQIYAAIYDEGLDFDPEMQKNAFGNLDDSSVDDILRESLDSLSEKQHLHLKERIEKKLAWRREQISNWC